MLGGGRCDVEVVRPQTRNKMNAAAWWVSLQPILTSHAKKRWKFQRLPFLCTLQVHPKMSQKFHSGGGSALEVALIEFVESACAACIASLLWSCLIFIHKEIQRFAGFGAFECAQRGPPQWATVSQKKRAFCTSRAACACWILQFEAYKLLRKIGSINIDGIREEYLLFFTFRWKASWPTCVTLTLH
jgi:hypothetical protein